VFSFFTGLPTKVSAQENVKNPTAKAKIIKEVEQSEGDSGLQQKLRLQITRGENKGEIIEITNKKRPNGSTGYYKQGDSVLIEKILDGKWVIQDYWKSDYIILLFIIFILLTLVILKWGGVSTLLSLSITFLVIIKMLLPMILSGFNPVFASILASIIIVPISFYLSHGLNKKTSIAIFSTFITLIAVGTLSLIFTNLSKITGIEQEGITYLQIFSGTQISFVGLFLAGIIIAAIGTLDDVTINQASVVNELKKANPRLSISDSYTRAMGVGYDHISSLVNTLILVYTGAFLPLMLLFATEQFSLLSVLNFEIVASEIIRTLVGSIGLILAVPLTTILASIFLDGDEDEYSHSHTHIHYH